MVEGGCRHGCDLPRAIVLKARPDCASDAMDEDAETIELDLAIGTYVSICFALGLMGLFSVGWLFHVLSGPWSIGSIVLGVLPLPLTVGAACVWSRSLASQVIHLDPAGIRVRVRDRDTWIPWTDITHVLLTRTSIGRQHGPVLKIECHGRPGLEFHNGYETSPEELFRVFDEFVRTRSIGVRVAAEPGWSSW